MGLLVARLFAVAKQILASKGFQLGTGAAAAADVLNIDILRREAVRLAPTSDPEALEEAARQIIRMLGLDGSNVIGPRDVARWNYFHMNMANGQAWFTSRYHSGKSVRGAQRRGSARGFGRGQRSIATISQAQGR